MHDQGPRWRGDLEALVGEPVGEVDLREGVRQSGVGAASAGKARCVVVAADDDRWDAVFPDRRQSPLSYPEGAVVGGRVVEDVAEPDDQVGLLRQGELYRGLERPLEVPFALVDPSVDRVREIRAPEVGIADGGNLHFGRPMLTSTPLRHLDHYSRPSDDNGRPGPGPG